MSREIFERHAEAHGADVGTLALSQDGASATAVLPDGGKITLALRNGGRGVTVRTSPPSTLITIPDDPGPGAEEELKLTEEWLGNGSRASGRRRALALIEVLASRAQLNQ